MPVTEAKYLRLPEQAEAHGIRAHFEGEGELVVPTDPANRHYREIMAAVEAGELTIDEADPEPPQPRFVDDTGDELIVLSSVVAYETSMRRRSETEEVVSGRVQLIALGNDQGLFYYLGTRAHKTGYASPVLSDSVALRATGDPADAKLRRVIDRNVRTSLQLDSAVGAEFEIELLLGNDLVVEQVRVTFGAANTVTRIVLEAYDPASDWVLLATVDNAGVHFVDQLQIRSDDRTNSYGRFRLRVVDDDPRVLDLAEVELFGHLALGEAQRRAWGAF